VSTRAGYLGTICPVAPQSSADVSEGQRVRDMAKDPSRLLLDLSHQPMNCDPQVAWY